jgi:hypothetical protein
MTSQAHPLSFAVVDDLGFAAANGTLKGRKAPERYAPRSLGPLLELLHLHAGHRLPDTILQDWLVVNGAASMIKALCQDQEAWISPVDRRMGFIHAKRRDPDGDNRFTAFLMDAQRAARDVTGLKGTTPGQLVAAMEELEGNIHEHSVAIESGRLAFRAAHDRFEFVVSDRGIGILRSLQRSPIYSSLLDHGKALEEAIKDGTSRFGNDGGRGYGFRPIFIGLTNLKGSLRFRSGDHALLMDGTSPSLTTAKLVQKPNIDGFLASITILIE